MYKLWAKKIKKNSIVNSIVVKNKEDISPLEKRDKCLKEICQKLDLSVPIWLKKHDLEFLQFNYVVFYPQDFVDEVDFDKLEVELLDDGKPLHWLNNFLQYKSLPCIWGRPFSLKFVV